MGVINDLTAYMQRKGKSITWLANQLDITKEQAKEKLETGNFTEREIGLIKIVIYSNF